jgi:branched-subunit amino acid aminotransferase/4-amino-4-deoxychorismate lyase
VVVTHQRGDPRRRPRVKGPDLAMLAALRESASRIGAGEVVLLTNAGLVIEGALSAVVWWRDDVLCVPDQSLATLDSVTRGLLTALALSRGLQVRPERATPESLDGLEVWSLSALHGIRPVTGWLHPESAPRLRPPRRAAAWQADLLALARPVALAARGRPRPADRREAGS